MTGNAPGLPEDRAGDATFDVVVVGSGAAGMTAALAAADAGLRTVVVEKAAHFGGSTARSGGGLWVPNNEVLRRAGAPDSPELASRYLEHLVGDLVPAEHRRALLSAGPAMLSFVCAHTPLRFTWVRGYSDYYPEAPGGLAEGRTVEPVPLDGRVLGAELAKLNPPYVAPPSGMTVTAAEYRWLNLIARHPRGMLTAARVSLRRIVSLARRRQLLALGQALAAGLRAGLQRAGVPVWLATPLVDLHVEAGRVAGVVVLRNGAEVLLRARHGVILASGGFEHNERMRKQYQRKPIGTEWTVGAAENTGDGIEAGQRLGAAVALMEDAWWGPSIPLSGGPYFCLSERTLPGCIMVNAAGRRFVNEAAPYVDAVHAMYAGNETGVSHIPAWLIADQRYRNRYTFAGLPPRQRFPGRWYKAGAVYSAGSIEDLARLIDVPGDELRATVRRFNGFAHAGRDEDFHRGESAYDHYYGDPRLPNPSLAPLEQAPFHAVRIVPGDLGTKGGLRTDAHARVLREDGTVIPGLYAAGNASAAVMGHTYAGAGATIGPAMTFGYLAALDIAARAQVAAEPARRPGPTRRA
ncbi:3-oxosteroid 1-dehydrogenase [Gandjariella thermophila]|uniref:3-oxosteroid 1-dehydrogenase n=1 Tax=Gandjariella thermophila TaxID=1931992 RepID=A0A4D4J3Z1_9PSEU|nr:3-oxosteroid 1-dehydrogenase [Gandjariella thermophila]GDY29792.1 3-ketosteroid-delta-1-dehydrogenase [Gandjariella thermophila]